MFGGKTYAAARASRGWPPVEKTWNGNSDPDLKHVGAILFEFRNSVYSAIPKRE